jgi:DNA-binding GntR family transcriptional regulator
MDVFSQIRPVSLREQVVTQIRNAIIEGRLKPNDHITELTLTQQLGVSRTPVREALILLEREGLVFSSPNRGCFVRAFTEQDVEHVFSMRTVLENFAGEIIINRLTDEDFTTLEARIDAQREAEEAGDVKKARSIDMGFHQYLINRSEHPLLMRNWVELVAQIASLLYIREEVNPHPNKLQAVEDHQAISKAYRSRDLKTLKAENTRINDRVASECRNAVARLNAKGSRKK